ncbi:MAG TPA: hypothetical protein DCZ94_09050 [Lentisphaeria bacterium]|nr:MAG: hypothetical protein A2X48_23355 [Lentisphaerae bacterium GWF2_49_21]HBC87087.1 hypothetical protein [Lentisphaeria bacterium]
MQVMEEEKNLIGGLMIGTENEVVTNPYSGKSVELCPEAVALYDLIKGAEMIGDYENVETGLAIFSRNWPDAYMVLLD